MPRKKKDEVATTGKIPPPKVVKVAEELSCQLNDVEWQNRAREMAEAEQSVTQAEEKKKSITKQASNDVAIAKARLSKLASIVSSKTETREVAVEITFDYEKGTVTRKRTDTGEVISERDMIDEERQTELVDAGAFIEDAGRGKDIPEGEVVPDDLPEGEGDIAIDDLDDEDSEDVGDVDPESEDEE